MLIITNIHYLLKFFLSVSQGIPILSGCFRRQLFVTQHPQPRSVAGDHINTSEPYQSTINEREASGFRKTALFSAWVTLANPSGSVWVVAWNQPIENISWTTG